MDIFNLLFIDPCSYDCWHHFYEEYEANPDGSGYRDGCSAYSCSSPGVYCILPNEMQETQPKCCLFMHTYTWFESLNIHYSIGVDGISVAMIMLTGCGYFCRNFCLMGGGFSFTRNFLFLLSCLSSGVFGFFISLDLFTMFLFYEVAVIPMYLLIGIWGSGRKNILP